MYANVETSDSRSIMQTGTIRASSSSRRLLSLTLLPPVPVLSSALVLWPRQQLGCARRSRELPLDGGHEATVGSKVLAAARAASFDHHPVLLPRLAGAPLAAGTQWYCIGPGHERYQVGASYLLTCSLACSLADRARRLRVIAFNRTFAQIIDREKQYNNELEDIVAVRILFRLSGWLAGWLVGGVVVITARELTNVYGAAL